MDNNELMHYGVIGMKWGVRKARKAANKSSKLFKKKNKLQTEQSESSKKKSKKSVKDMSDDELKKAISRLEMEKRYNDLSPKQVSKGKQFVSDFISKAVVPAVNEAGKNLARDYIMKVGKKKLGLDIKDDEQAYIDRLQKTVKKKMTLEKSYRNLKEELNNATKKETKTKPKEEPKKDSKTDTKPKEEPKKNTEDDKKKKTTSLAAYPYNYPRFF